MKKKARKPRHETRQATAQLCSIALQVQQLAARPVEAMSQSQLEAVCNNICDLVARPGLRKNKEQLHLLGQLQLPQLLAKLLGVRQLGSSGSRQEVAYYYKLSPVLRASVAVLDTAISCEDQDGGTTRQLLCCNIAHRIISCGVVAQITASMQDLAASLPDCQPDHPLHITDVPFLHLIWWHVADKVCAVACCGHTVAACAAVILLVIPVIKALGASAAAASHAHHCLLLLNLVDRLMQYQQHFPTGAWDQCSQHQDTQQQQQCCNPAVLQVAVVQLVLTSRRLCTRAAGKGGGSGSSSSRMAGSTPAAAAVEGIPVAAQALLPILQLHQQQLWQAIGLSSASMAAFDAAFAQHADRHSPDDAARFVEAAVEVRQQVESLMCQGAAKVTQEQLQQLPLHQKQLLQAVMWDLPVVLLGTATCFLELDPSPLTCIAHLCQCLLFCWQLSSESAAMAAAPATETTGGAGVSAPDPAACSGAPPTAGTAAAQQGSPQRQQALAHVLQCWLAVMQQQLLQEQQHSGPGALRSSSSSSSGESSSSSKSTEAKQCGLIVYKWEVVERLLHAMYHAALFFPHASAWHTHAAQLAITLELLLRAMLSPALTFDHGSQKHNAADNCCEEQQQQPKQQPAAQQHQLHTREALEGGTRSECLARLMHIYISCAGVLLFANDGTVPGPLLQAASIDATCSSSSSSHQLASWLASFFKVLRWSPESFCSQRDLELLEDLARTSRCILVALSKQPGTHSLAQLVAPWLVLQGRCLITLSAYIKQAVGYTSASGGGSTSNSRRSSSEGGSSSNTCSDKDIGSDNGSVNGNDGSSGDGAIFNQIIRFCAHCTMATNLAQHVWHALQWYGTLLGISTALQQQQQQEASTPSAGDAPQAHMAANAGAAFCAAADAAACRATSRGPARAGQGPLDCLLVPAERAESLAQAALTAAQQFTNHSSSSSSSRPVGGKEEKQGACCGNQGTAESSTSNSSSHNCRGSSSGGSGSSTSEDEAVGAKLSGGDATALQAAESPSECLSVLLQSSCIQALPQLLEDAGAALCTALPVPGICNNPGCSNMACSSELLLVGGKGSVCGGCKVARYCGRGCQAAHWKQHRPVCRYLASQQACGPAGDGATS